MYEYVTVRGPVPDVGGARVVGRWDGRASIGWASDETVLLLSWPEAPRGLPGDATVERLTPTARPQGALELPADGWFAHRWFDLAEADWDEFLALSVEAWPAFEAGYGVRVQGLFRSDAAAPGEARALLLTHYPTLGHWESSRGTAQHDAEAVRRSGANFRRRHELTRRTVVRAARRTL